MGNTKFTKVGPLMIQVISWVIIIGLAVVVYGAMNALYIDSLKTQIKQMEEKSPGF